MKIYTKKGDKGTTSLIGGKRVSKYHQRINAYGTIDELNSFIGLVRDVLKDAEERDRLYRVQNQLFNIGSNLASTEDSKMKLPEVTKEDVIELEKGIDRMESELPELKNFVLPGGHINVSYCHIARTVCRRAERLTVELHEVEPINEIILSFLNRLSDYLFVLARFTGKELNVEEIPWKSR